MQEDSVHKYIAYICHTHPIILKSEPNGTLIITEKTCMTFFMWRVCIVLLKTCTKSARKVAIGTKRKIKNKATHETHSG